MSEQPIDNEWDSPRAVALFAAVLYHGLTALSPVAKPAGINTVMATAREFGKHLDSERGSLE